MRLDVGPALDPLEIPGALSIAITCSELCTSVVVTNPLVTVLVHLYEVNSSVQATFSARHVNSEGHFLTNQVELFVLAILRDKETSANIDGVRTLGDITKLHPSFCLVHAIGSLPLLFRPSTNSA